MIILYYSVTSFLIALLIAQPLIQLLRRLKSQQQFRALGPQSHIETKAGTPTMGAWIFLVPILLLNGYLFLKNLNQELLLVMIGLIAGTVLGAWDDGLKLLKKNYKGLDSKLKLLLQFIVSVAIAHMSGRYMFSPWDTYDNNIPAWMIFAIEVLWAFLVIAGTSNAINLSDGLDGLATILSVLAFGACAWYFYSQVNFSMLIFCLIVITALIGFLIFNYHPAKIFMGDTGSLALGMALGTIAYVENIEWYLLIFALVPVLESVSVILQVASSQISRRFFGKDWRIFKMAPLHHHLELSGLKELQIFFLLAGLQLVAIIIFFATNSTL